MTGEGLIVFKFKGTVMQIEKILTNDPLHVSQKYPENFAVIYVEICYFLKM